MMSAGAHEMFLMEKSSVVRVPEYLFSFILWSSLIHPVVTGSLHLKLDVKQWVSNVTPAPYYCSSLSSSFLENQEPKLIGIFQSL